MASIQFSGINSGLDTKSVIDALMQSVQAPLTRLQTQEANLTATSAAVGDVRTSFTDLLTRLRAFTEQKAGAGMAATSGAPLSFTASATSAAASASYSVKVDRVATPTVARSTAAIGRAVTDGTQMLSALPLPGTVTAGSAGIVVDGTVVRVTVGNPAVTSLDSLGGAIAGAIQAQLRTAGDAGATVTYSVVANRIQLALTGASGSHEVRFGVAGDTSNAFGILGLATAGGTVANGGTISGTSLLGVVQANAKLADGFTGLTAATLSLNGVAFAYDPAVDTLASLLSRINSSAAGVTASIDRAADRVVLTAKSAGATALDITDTGGLATALGLAPGTTGAQTLGQNAQVTVNGTAYTSQSNTVTDAIEGVTLKLTAEMTSATTLTVGTDRTSITAALQAVVDSYNSLADKIASYSSNDPSTTKRGVLTNDLSVSGLLVTIRTAIFSSTAAPGPYNNLAALGVNTGGFGAAKGTTDRLKLDTAKLNAALDANPTAVADLLDSTSGALKPITDQLNAYAGPAGIFFKRQQTIADQVKSIVHREADVQSRIDAHRATLEAKYATLESLLSRLQSTGSQLSSQTAAMNKSTG